MRRTIVLAVALLTACSVSAASASPGDQRLAERVAPTAADVGAHYRRASPAALHARGLSCPATTTGCAWRFFTLPDGPQGVASATALVEVFAGPAQARSAFARGLRNLARSKSVRAGVVRETISLRSETHLSTAGAQATLLVFRVAVTAPLRVVQTSRSILLLEGRAEVFLSYKAGRTVDFPATARRLAARLRPARG